LKVIFVGDYQTNDILAAPTKVAKELFNHFSLINPEIFYYSYFQEGAKYSRYKKIFGKNKLDNNVYRLGLFPFVINILKQKPDIVFALTPAVYYLPILIIRKIVQFKFVYYVHSVNKCVLNNYTDLTRFQKFRFLFIEKISVKYSDLIFTLSNKELELLKQNYPKTKQNINVVNNGINYYNIKKKSYRVDQVLNIICVGNFQRREKAYDILLGALNDLKFSVNLTICSHTKQNDSTIKISKNINLIYYTFNEVQLRKKISQNDLFIISSSYEPFSIALLEAMSTGIPFISTDQVGLTERFVDGVLQNQVIPFNNSPTLMKKILDFLNMTENQKEQIGEKGIEFAKNYTWDLVALQTFNRLNQIYEYVKI